MNWKRSILTLICLSLGISQGGAVIKRTLLDFAQYDEKIKAQFPDPAQSYVTNIDGSPKAIIGYGDYLLEKWRVSLNASANSMENRVLSYSKPVKSNRFGTVLGVRIHFPTWNNNSYALIHPPFPIKVYNDDGQFANAENGVMPNAWELRSLSIWINGRNYNNQIAIRLKDRNDNVQEYFMGNVYYEGWRKLTWLNPNFTDKVYAKSLTKVPLYPRDIPYLTFDSIVVYRQGSEWGGDFVTYIGAIEIEYTPYIVDRESVEDIEDEAVWQIIANKGKRATELENKKLAEKLILYQQEEYRLKIERDQAVPQDQNTGN